MSYDANLKGKLLYAGKQNVNLRSTPGTALPPLKTVALGTLIGQATGVFTAMADGKWLQYYTDIDKTKYAYVRQDLSALSDLTQPAQATQPKQTNPAQTLPDVATPTTTGGGSSLGTLIIIGIIAFAVTKM